MESKICKTEDAIVAYIENYIFVGLDKDLIRPIPINAVYEPNISICCDSLYLWGNNWEDVEKYSRAPENIMEWLAKKVDTDKYRWMHERSESFESAVMEIFMGNMIKKIKRVYIEKSDTYVPFVAKSI